MILPIILMILSIYILGSIAQGQGKVTKQQKSHLCARANCIHAEGDRVIIYGPDHHMTCIRGIATDGIEGKVPGKYRSPVLLIAESGTIDPGIRSPILLIAESGAINRGIRSPVLLIQ